MAGRGVSQVVQRYEIAKETGDLDLSNCDLITLPDAIFFVLKEYTIRLCNISRNKMKKFPAKMGTKFPELSSVNASHNAIVSLPEELTAFTRLRVINLSYNAFSVFPVSLLDVASLHHVDLSFNQISEVDFDAVSQRLTRLRQLNLSDNPMNRQCLVAAFANKPAFNIVFQMSIDKQDGDDVQSSKTSS